MIKILDTKQIKALDAYTIQHEPISSIDLMERACRAFVEWFVQRFDATKKIGVVCGTGNNGGDGLGIARLLNDWGYRVTVWIVRGGVPESNDFKVNLDRLRGKVDIFEIVTERDKGVFEGQNVLIDAIFGSGLSRPIEGIYAQAINCFNATTAVKLSIDIPSGLMADGPSTGEIVRAHHTITFQLPKLCFFFPNSFQYVGEWHVVDIGLSKTFIKDAETTYFWLTHNSVRKLIRPRLKFDHKGTFGHALLIAGSYGKTGAATLASRAVLRSGVGLLTVHIPACGYNIIQVTVPEAMVSVDSDEKKFTSIEELEKYSTIGVGPGLGQAEETARALKNILEKFRKPIVLDADALNLLSTHSQLLDLLPEGCILTPHPKEFERLAGKSANDFERLEKQKALARRIKGIVILKGAFTSICTQDGSVYFNSTGNPGMATGGTGDVLTGILTGLLAQNYSPVKAAIIGVFAHGLAGDLAAVECGHTGLIASDLIEFLPRVWLKINAKKPN